MDNVFMKKIFTLFNDYIESELKKPLPEKFRLHIIKNR